MTSSLVVRLTRTRCLPVQAAVAGLFAGTVATLAQMLLWWLGGTDVFDTLLRDARLAAAIIMGGSLFDTMPRWRWDVLLWATFIHYGLSFAYAALALPVACRLAPVVSVIAGAAYGVAIYVIDLYGFALLFPWMDMARGPVTLLTHIVFGVSLVASCRWFGASDRGETAI